MNLGVREIVYGLVGLLLTYLGWLLARFLLLGAKGRRANAGPDVPTLAAVVPDSEYSAGEAPADARPARQMPRPPAEPDASAFGFDALLEVRQMRHLIDEMRFTLQDQRRDIDALRETLAELRAANQVSPAYSEAVALAQRGYEAHAIAERCGISVAEAQLVRSLSADADRQELGNE